MAKSKEGKKKKVTVPTEGIVHIRSSFNNVIVTITDKGGNVIAWSSAGKCGFRGSKKGTPYAAQVAATDAAKAAYEMGMRVAEVRIQGPGSGREAAIQAVANAGIQITRLVDITPIPHNGCRPPKKRRV
jgi:small subunit ribosomal protein S11